MGDNPMRGVDNRVPIFDVLQERKGDAPAKLLQIIGQQVWGTRMRSGRTANTGAQQAGRLAGHRPMYRQKLSHLVRHAEKCDAIVDHNVEQVALLGV